MIHITKRVIIHALGWILIVAGIVGFFLPFLQGFLMLAVGLYLVSFEVHPIRRAVLWLAERHPRVKRLFEKADGRVKKFLTIEDNTP